MPAMTPILAVESVDIDRDRRPIVYHETRFAGERVQFVVKHARRPVRLGAEG